MVFTQQTNNMFIFLTEDYGRVVVGGETAPLLGSPPTARLTDTSTSRQKMQS